jgi:hypothetical protein
MSQLALMTPIARRPERNGGDSGVFRITQPMKLSRAARYWWVFAAAGGIGILLGIKDLVDKRYGRAVLRFVWGVALTISGILASRRR